jgi:ABC-type Fe3+/spermidine/putrescine transport system ATPase subunit
LARTLAGLVPPSGGRILVAGSDLTGKLPDARWIGYLVVGAELLPHLTVEQNIRYGLGSPLLVRSLLDAEVEVLTERLDLVVRDRFREPLPHLVSPERRFRTGLARAALRSPGAIVVEVPDAVTTTFTADDFVNAVLPDEEPPVIVFCVGDRDLLDRDVTVHLMPKPKPSEADKA